MVGQVGGPAGGGVVGPRAPGARRPVLLHRSNDAAYWPRRSRVGGGVMTAERSTRRRQLTTAALLGAFGVVTLVVLALLPTQDSGGLQRCTHAFTGTSTATTATSGGVFYTVVTLASSGTFTAAQPLVADVVGVDGAVVRSGIEIPSTPIDVVIGAPPGVSSFGDLALAIDGDAVPGAEAPVPGAIVLRYPAICQNPSQPVSLALAGTRLSWSAPVYVPVGQTVTSYDIVYRPRGSEAWAAYANGSSATSADIGSGTSAACAAANPGWACPLTRGELVAGEAYEFGVFARTSTGALGAITAPPLVRVAE